MTSPMVTKSTTRESSGVGRGSATTLALSPLNARFQESGLRRLVVVFARTERRLVEHGGTQFGKEWILVGGVAPQTDFCPLENPLVARLGGLASGLLIFALFFALFFAGFFAILLTL